MKFIRTTRNLLVSDLVELAFDWGIVHMLTDDPMSLDEVVQAAESYNEQFKHENAPFATDASAVALSLIRLCEFGLAKGVIA